MRSRFSLLFRIVIMLLFTAGAFFLLRDHIENYLLKMTIARLTADTRVAEVIVTDVSRNEQEQKTFTTIKFLEYDVHLRPLAPRFFTFSGNLIQFQSLVIRFDDRYVRRGDPFRGRSAFFFMKAFHLTDHGVESFDITRANETPAGYNVPQARNMFQQWLWQRFWEYALAPEKAARAGIKNVQIEAPGTRFVPGLIYTLKIEHDGGLRIDTRAVPVILRE